MQRQKSLTGRFKKLVWCSRGSPYQFVNMHVCMFVQARVKSKLTTADSVIHTFHRFSGERRLNYFLTTVKVRFGHLKVYGWSVLYLTSIMWYFPSNIVTVRKMISRFITVPAIVIARVSVQIHFYLNRVSETILCMKVYSKVFQHSQIQ